MPKAKASKNAAKTAPNRIQERLERLVRNPWFVAQLVICCLWFILGTSLASHIYLVVNYETIACGGPAWLEPLLASQATWWMCAAFSYLILYLTAQQIRAGHSDWRTSGLLIAACLPLVLTLMRGFDQTISPPSYFAVLWFVFWTSLAVRRLASLGNHLELDDRAPDSYSSTSVWLAGTAMVLACTGWWYAQSSWYFQHFLLGYNDFGHFTQRIANTTAGRGLLLESPVLPMFWDHFNPGILVLAPIWWLAPVVQTVFAVQAACIAISGLLIGMLARELGHSRGTVFLLTSAWLAQPCAGQMNLAFTYGWHPISLAIPLLLLGLITLLRKQFLASAFFVALALMMEEGVWVVCALFSCVCAFWAWRGDPRASIEKNRCIHILSYQRWSLLACMFTVGFLLVYFFSGLREFQTGRFVALGDNAGAIILSPILRPIAFWGQLAEPRNYAFLLSLILPCGVYAVLRGWRLLLATVPALALLLVWDHAPSTSIAFQYSSALLPVIWVAVIDATPRGSKAMPDALTAVFAGLLLSIYVGQMPYSCNSLADATTRTYGPEATLSRGPDSELGIWLSEEITELRAAGGPYLATGRIAAHLVGISDLETVGQFAERRELLARLPQRRGSAILGYRWIVLDLEERFQQPMDLSEELFDEALSSGFEVLKRNGPIVILHRSPP